VRSVRGSGCGQRRRGASDESADAVVGQRSIRGEDDRRDRTRNDHGCGLPRELADGLDRSGVSRFGLAAFAGELRALGRERGAEDE
jgi:hypothetical protein